MEQVSYDRLARRELNEAAQYYESENPGLGVALLDEVERCTQAIVNFPEAGSLITKTIHRRLVFRFPYALFYFHEAGQGPSVGGHEPETPTDVLGGSGVNSEDQAIRSRSLGLWRSGGISILIFLIHPTV